MPKFILFISQLIFCSLFSHASIEWNKLESLMFRGDFDQCTLTLNRNLQTSSSSKSEQIKIYQVLGDIAKLSGDIEFALENWQKAARLRTSIYPNKKDYHHAWTYANYSNYYYEKIDRTLAKKYADSCAQLIQRLNVNQQKELEIFKIWNILAQSYKQSSDASNYIKHIANYSKIIEFYKKSEIFIIKHGINKHFLGNTLHLMGNAYLDITFTGKNNEDHTKAKAFQNTAIQYYDKAIVIWKKLYGNVHFELGKTFFVKGLLYHYLSSSTPNLKRDALYNFRLATESYGINLSNSQKLSIQHIPNKVDLLMTLKYYTKCLLALHAENRKDEKFLNEAFWVNNKATAVWNQIHNSFKGQSINQNLAIYNLIPQEEEITIVMRQKLPEKVKTERFFRANQKLKYYDLFKSNKGTSSYSISTIQKRLKQNQVMLDFHFNQNDNVHYILFIQRNLSQLKKLDASFSSSVLQLKTAILESNFSEFTLISRQLFEAIFPKGISQSELIICPDAQFNNLPFEVLLYSNKNTSKTDFRKLDYLLNHSSIRYVLTPGSFTNETVKVNGDLDVFCPQSKNGNFANLPFSNAFGVRMHEEMDAVTFLKDKATKQAYFRSRSKIKHISSHAIVGVETSSNFILMSDGKLTQEELSNFKFLPNLIVLNTCNSGNGKLLPGDGVDGFVRELHLSGVPATISNQWEVDDKASNELLFNFYREFKNGSNSSEALRTVKLSQIKNAPSSELGAPYYWAGNRLVGKVIEIEPKFGSSIWIQFLLIGVSLSFIALFVKRIY